MKIPMAWNTEPVLVEQLRLVLTNIRDSFVFVVPAICVVAWWLYEPLQARALGVWAGATLGVHGLRAWHARSRLRVPTAALSARRIAWEVLGLSLCTGLCWGALQWTPFGPASVAELFLIYTAIFLIVTSSVTMLAPFVPAFVVFVGAICTLVFVRRISGADVDSAMPPGVPLFIALLLIQHTRNLAKGVRRTIEIRFENTALLAQVRDETRKALQAQDVALRANEGKTRFLAAASHDLRQPMHALGLFLALLGRSPLEPRQQVLLGNAQAMSDAASGMLGTLLDYARIEAGAVSAKVRIVALQPLLYKIETELAPQANAKGLVYRSRETAVAALSDPALLEMILRNLVGNAIRYTARGGVLVACRLRGPMVWLEVWDTGIGIAPAQQAEIFREFHQLDNPERDRERGLGLGLAIVDSMARTLGHPLRLVSRPGRGSVFRLGLPLAGMTPAPGPQELPPAAAQPPGRHVLVIDDDADVRSAMAQLLRDWDCPCDVVGSLADALRSARQRRPAFIVSDYRLQGGRTGAEAIATLRQMLGSEVPALLVTGDTDPRRLLEATQSGIPLLHKPVAPAELRRRIALQ